ncbi:general secretion pathway protein GspF [Clostridium acetobutylicum]|nr:general secretion pathway protein GspF [Clostridium acetobutylicum]
MKEYRYKAINMEGNVVKGESFSNSEYELIMELRHNKYFLISSKVIAKKKFIRNKKVSSKELYIFSKQMSYMMNAGFNICESLSIMYDKFQGNMRRIIKCIENGVENGNSIYKSVQYCGDSIPYFFKSMLFIGEESGNLSEVFRNLGEYYKDQWKTKEKIKNATTYPAIVFVFTIIILVFLVSKVIPRFVETLNSLGGKLPKITEFILSVSFFIKDDFIGIIAFILIIYGISKKLLRVKKNRMKLDELKFRIPFLSEIYKNKIALRFSNTLYILIKSGIDIIKAMHIASKVLENTYAEKCIKDIIENLRNGKDFRESFQKINIFTRQTKNMLIMAEECGNIEEIMRNISDLYREQFKDDLKRIINFIEPCMIIFLAVFVGTVIISSILPMINIMNSI